MAEIRFLVKRVEVSILFKKWRARLWLVNATQCSPRSRALFTPKGLERVNIAHPLTLDKVTPNQPNKEVNEVLEMILETNTVFKHEGILSGELCFVFLGISFVTI